MMKVSTTALFESVSADETRVKKKIPYYVLLTPDLAKTIQAIDITPATIHVAMVNQLATSLEANQPPPAKDGSES